METKLKELVNANRPENRKRWAMRWKEERSAVVGIIGPNVPEEIIFTAGLLPWLVSGTWDANTPMARAHRPWMTNVFCTHVLESFLNGELDFINAVVTTQQDDDFKRLWDVMRYLNKPSFNHIMYLPHVNNAITLQAWTESVMELKTQMEGLAGRVITDEALTRTIDTYNNMRQLLHKIYELRKRDVPPLTGAEILGITTAAKVMPKDVYNSKLEELMPFIEKRKAPLKQKSPRILVTGDYLDHPGYLELIESAGCVVAMDDLDTGSRYFWNPVETRGRNLYKALAKRYLNVLSPRFENWEEQTDQLIDWVKEFKIDGIIELRQLYSFPREFRFSYTAQRIKEAGIPHLFLRVEYHYAGEGMLRTRIEAFLEMLNAKGVK